MAEHDESPRPFLTLNEIIINNHKMKIRSVNTCVLFALFMVLLPMVPWMALTRAGSDTGVTDRTIILGQSCALSGPANHLGRGMRAGLTAAFEEINLSGGVQGRQIFLMTIDDFYEPGQAIRNTEALIRENEVFMLVGQVGTPTAEAVIGIAEKYQVPFFAPLTGAQFLRTPFNRNIINLRAGYNQEIQRLVDFFVEEKHRRKIACFYQDDSFGLSGFQGLKAALKKHHLTLAGQGTFLRNTIAILAGLEAIEASSADAVVLVGTHLPCAEFIKLAKARGMFQPCFATISFSGARTLAHAIGNIDQEVVVSQVMPDPYTSELPIAADYRVAMKVFQPQAEISYSSLEGYVAGRLFVAIVEAAPAELTRKVFLETLEKQQDLNLGGLQIQFGPLDHQGMDQTYLLLINNREIRPLP